jgi:hypothetical protein
VEQLALERRVDRDLPRERIAKGADGDRRRSLKRGRGDCGQ